MKKFFKYFLLFLPFTMAISSSCVKNETCISANNLLMIDLYQVESDTSIMTLTVDSLTLYFEGREDSLVYDNVKEVSSIDIPLSDTTETLKIIIKINDGYDEIILDYRPYFVFRSSECGVINRYEVKNALHTNDKIQALYLENKDIDESESVNLFMVVDID